MSKKEKRDAWINWSKDENKWILRLWIDDEWQFSKSWGVEHKGNDETYGNPIDFVSDSILCEIAHLQEIGYDVKVTA